MYHICQQRQPGYCHSSYYLVLRKSRVYSSKWLLFVWHNRAICYTFAFVDFKLQVISVFIQLHIWNTVVFLSLKNTCCSSAGDQALMNEGLALASASRRKVGAMSAEAFQGWIHDTRWYFLQCQSGSMVFQADPLPESQRWVPQGAISCSLALSSQSSSQDKYRFNWC